MKTTVKVISEIQKVAKNGALYKLVYLEIQIGSEVFVRKFAIFSK